MLADARIIKVAPRFATEGAVASTPADRARRLAPEAGVCAAPATLPTLPRCPPPPPLAVLAAPCGDSSGGSAAAGPAWIEKGPCG